MPTDLRSVMDAFRSDMLADVTRALSESPRQAESGGQASEQGGTSRSHKRRYHSRRRRPSSSSSSSDESSYESTDGQDARGATTSHGANPAAPPTVDTSKNTKSASLGATHHRAPSKRKEKTYLSLRLTAGQHASAGWRGVRAAFCSNAVPARRHVSLAPAVPLAHAVGATSSRAPRLATPDHALLDGRRWPPRAPAVDCTNPHATR